MKFLEPELAIKFIEMCSRPYRPPQIIALREKIAGANRSAELHFSATGQVDENKVRQILRMKLKLDDLSMDWAQGKIE